MVQATLPSPIGTILIDCDDRWLLTVSIRPDLDLAQQIMPNALARAAAEQMRAYFAGELTSFDLPVKPLASPRGEALRAAICAIPYGSTLSYGGVAHAVDSGPRAIGQACRRNPLPIIVPCHRVTASGGAIGYYSGGKGVETKTWLLHHEAGHI
jgi:methylated-DNA-[protein]-cysteine S-methyltransferase